MMRDIETDLHLNKIIQPLATFEGSGQQETYFINIENKNEYSDKEEFVAIAEVFLKRPAFIKYQE